MKSVVLHSTIFPDPSKTIGEGVPAGVHVGITPTTVCPTGTYPVSLTGHVIAVVNGELTDTGAGVQVGVLVVTTG